MDVKNAVNYAGEHVKMFHFDYTALSDTERTVFRRVMPFYTWSRKNVPLQLQMVMDNPGKFARAGKLQRNLESEFNISDEDRGHMPGWAQENIPIPMPFQKNGNQTYLSGLFPQTDLNRVQLGTMIEDVMSQLSPVFKAPIEIGMNQNALTGAPIWQSEYNKTGDILDYLMHQTGAVRNVSQMVSGEESKGAFKAAAPAMFGGSLLKEYDIDKATINDLYEYLRQARQYKNYVEDSTGFPLPSVR